MTQSSAGIDPLYEAIVQMEDAANTVGSLTVVWMGAYRQLTDSLSSGHNEAEARTRFELETALLADAHTCWAGAAAVLNAQIADGAAWQAWFMEPRKRCAQCGAAETWRNRWTHAAGCNECYADGAESAEHADTPPKDHWAGYPAMLSERSWRPE